MSTVDQVRALNKLKHDLEPWRNIIVLIDSLLTWEKNYYPAIVAGGVTAFFIILWLIDLSVVTLAAVSGLLLIAFDYLYPQLAKFIFKTENWDANMEASYTRICEQINGVKYSINGWYDFLFNSKERNHLFAVITTVVLLALAWIGAIINNLLLMYLITLVVFLMPGMKNKNVFSSVKELFGGKMQQLRDKAMKIE